MIKIVKFKSLLEEDNICFGILKPDNMVLCLDCLGVFEEEDYEILEEFDIDNIPDEFMEEYQQWIRS